MYALEILSWPPSTKFGIQIGSDTDDIGMLLLGDMRYTSLDPA